jgi:hypothetical protein
MTTPATYLTGATLYTAVLADIYSITNRPDRTAETAIALRKATMKFHLAEQWAKDIGNVQVTLPVVTSGDSFSYRYTLDLSQAGSLPYFRKLSEIREYNNPLIGNEYHFKPLDNDRRVDDYVLEDINYYTVVGQAAQLRVNKQLTVLDVDYYLYPDITATQYNSWIAQQFQDAIVCEAAANVFAMIGKDAESQRYAGYFNENLLMLQMQEIIVP